MGVTGAPEELGPGRVEGRGAGLGGCWEVFLFQETQGSIVGPWRWCLGRAPQNQGEEVCRCGGWQQRNNEGADVGGRWAPPMEQEPEGQAGLMTEWGSGAPGEGARQQENGYRPQPQGPNQVPPRPCVLHASPWKPAHPLEDRLPNPLPLRQVAFPALGRIRAWSLVGRRGGLQKYLENPFLSADPVKRKG